MTGLSCKAHVGVGLAGCANCVRILLELTKQLSMIEPLAGSLKSCSQDLLAFVQLSSPRQRTMQTSTSVVFVTENLPLQRLGLFCAVPRAPTMISRFFC